MMCGSHAHAKARISTHPLASVNGFFLGRSALPSRSLGYNNITGFMLYVCLEYIILRANIKQQLLSILSAISLPRARLINMHMRNKQLFFRTPAKYLKNLPVT